MKSVEDLFPRSLLLGEHIRVELLSILQVDSSSLAMFFTKRGSVT